MKRTADIVVIGGGVIGTSIAYYLSRKGKAVTLVEKNDLASGSSGACDIMIILQSKNPGVHLRLAMESAGLYGDLARELDYDIEYDNVGGMIVIEDDEQMMVMEDFVKRQKAAGLQVEIMNRKDASVRQPGLAPHVLGATFCPRDSHVNPMKLCLGFAAAASRYGADIMTGTGVTAITVKNGEVKSVVTTRGEIETETVINAAGVYAPMIGEMVGLPLPIIPRRGQIAVTEPVPRLVTGDTLCAKYIVAKHNPKLSESSDDPEARLGVGLALSQTKSGEILIGGSREFSGYNTNTTHEGLQTVLRHAARLLPVLKDIHIIRTFAGLRPYTPDGLPLLGRVKNIEGFIMAAGHEGDGIALSPVTGKLISELVTEGKTSFDLSPFDPERFS